MRIERDSYLITKFMLMHVVYYLTYYLKHDFRPEKIRNDKKSCGGVVRKLVKGRGSNIFIKRPGK